MKKQETGFTLLETLVAVAVFMMAILGPLALTTYSMRSITYARNQITAYYLAEEGIELARMTRDTARISGSGNWLSDLNNCFGAQECYFDTVQKAVDQCSPGPCPKVRYDSTTGFYNQYGLSPTNTETIFTRSMRVEKITDHSVPPDDEEDEARITVKVFWEDKSGRHEIVVEGYIFNY